ncbi:MAG: hypothetical protein AB1446_01415 [Bacillota bacterium]
MATSEATVYGTPLPAADSPRSGVVRVTVEYGTSRAYAKTALTVFGVGAAGFYEYHQYAEIYDADGVLRWGEELTKTLPLQEGDNIAVDITYFQSARWQELLAAASDGWSFRFTDYLRYLNNPECGLQFLDCRWRLGESPVICG